MKAVSLISLFLALAFCARAQPNKDKPKSEPPDLSGLWLLDESRSNVGRGKDRISDYSLSVVHREPEIRMTKKYMRGGRHFNEELIYYTDGRPELKGGRLDSQSVTRWRSGKLVSRSTFAPNGLRTEPPLEIITTEEWELSKDGKTLTRTITMTGTFGSKTRYVFNRSP